MLDELADLEYDVEEVEKEISKPISLVVGLTPLMSSRSSSALLPLQAALRQAGRLGRQDPRYMGPCPQEDTYREH